MSDNDHKAPEKKVDEDWKKRAREEAKAGAGASGPDRGARGKTAGAGRPDDESSEAAQEVFDVLPPFVRLLADLGVQASIHLGLVENPATGEKKTDLEAAKRLLDVLGALEEKTRGNLSADEAAYLEDLLYSLRMGYVRLKG